MSSNAIQRYLSENRLKLNLILLHTNWKQTIEIIKVSNR